MITSNQKKSAQEFIDLLSPIPDSNWCVDEYNGQDGTHCVLGHIGPYSLKAYDLRVLFESIDASPTMVNDGREERFQEQTPKARVLSALETIKNGGKKPNWFSRLIHGIFYYSTKE